MTTTLGYINLHRARRRTTRAAREQALAHRRQTRDRFYEQADELQGRLDRLRIDVNVLIGQVARIEHEVRELTR